ncbi:MAG: transketolase family protein [Clostridia bacterium]|nr:transketolase family protein [Clostridia bacterium]
MSYTIRNTFEKSAVEMRKVYTDTLIDMARKNDKICILDADLVGSSGTKAFFKEFPERAIDCGIQEANMIGVAAGLSAVGMVPYAHSFAPFATRRVLDQIFISCAYAKNNVRIVGTDPGVTAAYNGGTHMPFEDMGCLMSIPQITLIEPADTVQLEWVIRELENTHGVYYIRLLRKNAMEIFEPGSKFEFGKAPVVRDGNDVVIIASGIMLHEAIKAADELQKEGISAAVLNAFTWKPLDNETIPAYAKKCGAVVTAENHNVVGGLGSAVAHCLAMNCPTPMEMVGVQDEFGEVGTEDFLRNRFNLTAAEIVKKAKAAIAKK